jgi:hypothetical protein
MSEFGSSMGGIVRRSALIVIVATLAGALVGGIVTFAKTTTTYTGSADITIDQSAIVSYPRSIKPDAVLAAKADPAVIAAVAKAAGVSEAQVPGMLKVFTVGNPQDSIKVTFVATDKSAAAAGAKAGAQAVSTYALKAVDKTLASALALIKIDETALANFDQTATGDAANRASLRWSLERALATDKEQYAWLSGAYTYAGAVAVKQSARQTAMAQAVGAGALAGLFLGLVLAAAREVSRRRTS